MEGCRRGRASRGVESCSVPREWGMSPLSSPHGGEMHKPRGSIMFKKTVKFSFRPLAGLSCINLIMWRWRSGIRYLSVSVPSRG